MYMYVCTCRNDIIQWVCRAPPWRQVLGDICHVNVVPCDAVLMCVTASTEEGARGKGRRRGKGGWKEQGGRGGGEEKGVAEWREEGEKGMYM